MSFNSETGDLLDTKPEVKKEGENLERVTHASAPHFRVCVIERKELDWSAGNQ